MTDLWDAFRPHRARVTAVLEEQHRRVFQPDDISPPWAPKGVLCLLGAGNANDVDLSRLLRRFDMIELVDIDHAAVERGATRQLGASARLARVRLMEGSPYSASTTKTAISCATSASTAAA